MTDEYQHKKMKQIFKYKLQITDLQRLDLPIDATILTAQVQKEELFIWVLVTPDAPKQYKKIRIIGTGHPIPDEPISKVRYINTVQFYGGDLVWHVFEVMENLK